MISSKMSKRFMVFSVMFIAFYMLNIYGCKKHEHPEHPEGPEAKVSMEELADAMEEYINEQAAAHGGRFAAIDEREGKMLSLTLERIHREKLAMIAEDTYFACADFTDEDGKVYDLDVFMSGPDKDNLVFSEITVHKEDGVARYTWYEEGGIWKKKVEGEEVAGIPGKEHPNDNEHPENKENSENNEHPENKENPENNEHPEGKEHPK